MDVLSLLDDTTCLTRLQARKKEACLLELATLVGQAVQEIPRETIFTALYEREKMGSTGFDNGIAIPHCKIAGLDRFVLALAVSPKGVQFESFDKKKSHLFFVIVGPEDKPKEHLNLLAQVSRVARHERARNALLRARTPVALKETFIKYLHGRALPAREESQNKKLLIVVLYEERFFEEILHLFVELDIRGATIMESSGMKDQLSSIPIFGDFLNFLGEQSDASKTIMTVVPENLLAETVSGIEDITGDLDTHTGAMVAALDIGLLKGSLEM